MDREKEDRICTRYDPDTKRKKLDVETQEPIGSPLAVEPDTFVSAAFSPDGARLYAVSTGRRGIRLETDPDAWKGHACLVSGPEADRARMEGRAA
jgi:hypothetical protein